MRPMLPTLLLGFLIAGFMSATASATSIEVPNDQPTIQAGIDAASPGDTVLVATGTFQGAGNNDVDFNGKDVVVRSSEGSEFTHLELAGGSYFTLANGESQAATIEGFTLQGGVWGIKIRNGAAPTIRDCVISGATLSGCDAREAGPFSLLGCKIRDSGTRGVYISDPGLGVTISGCEISNNSGGGMYLEGARSIDIVDCDFEGNTSNTHGCGLWLELEGGVANIIGCRFVNNSRTVAGISGGGARLQTAPSIADKVFNVQDCLFDGNIGSGSGGGLSFSSSDRTTATIQNCIFRANRSQTAGGLSYYLSGSLPFTPIIDCVFVDNVASGSAGGLFFTPWATIGTVLRCVFLRNDGYSAGAAQVQAGHGRFESCTMAENRVFNGSVIQVSRTEPTTGELTLDRTIVAFSGGTSGTSVNCGYNPGHATCTNIFGNSGGDWVDCLAGQLGVQGNISKDPRFCNLADDDLGLDATSPCAPANSEVGCELIGAFPVACGEAAHLDADLQAAAPLELYAMPNPIETHAVLLFGEATIENGPSRVEIYDPAGRLVHADWVSQSSTVWRPASSLAPGVYLARVTQGTRSGTAKLVLAR